MIKVEMDERTFELKKRFLILAKKVKREGINELLKWLDDSGFYQAPASTNYHLATEGGLVEHSINVCETALKLNETLDNPVDEESVIIAALFHDLGKHKYYNKDFYVENILKSGKRSDAKPYERNKEILNIPHEVTSLQLASGFINLTEEETWAILHHNGMYGDLKYSLSGKETPLQIIIHSADMWASRVIER